MSFRFAPWEAPFCGVKGAELSAPRRVEVNTDNPNSGKMCLNSWCEELRGPEAWGREVARICAASGPASVGLRSGIMLLELEDASVGMIDDLGEKEKVVATEVGGVLPFLAVLVKAGEGDAVPKSGF